MKTIKIINLIDHINSKLKLDTITKEQKQILCTFLECILSDTNNYNGFGYNGDYRVDEYNRTYFKNSRLTR